MADLNTQLDALGRTMRALAQLDPPPASSQLDHAASAFDAIAGSAIRAGAWATAEDALRDVVSLLEDLDRAIAPLCRGRSSAPELEDVKLEVKEEVKPERGEGDAGTPAEEDGNPFGGILGVFASPAHAKRETAPSPTPPPPPPFPPPYRSPFDLPLAQYPALPVPYELLDPSSGLPIFSVPFIRVQGGHQISGHSQWSDIGGNFVKMLTEDGKLCPMPEINLPPSAPGYPCAGFISDAYHQEVLNAGPSRQLFVKATIDGVDGWPHRGNYRICDRRSVTGAQLAQLDPAEKARWVKLFNGFRKMRERKLLQWGLDPELKGGEAIWNAVVAGGASTGIPYSIFRCEGYDVEAIKGWVAKYEERLRLEALFEVEEAERQARGETDGRAGQTKAKKGKKARKAEGPADRQEQPKAKRRR
ncbi:hypothetical protein JCM10213_002563 [Rhodosporidiobolus nylandii]